MIGAKQASENAQIRNRNKWIEATVNAISKTVEESSKNGLRRCNITTTLYVGAENLSEASEALLLLEKELQNHEYEHYIDENGILVIEW